jgi:prephenate dehydratase
MNFAYLDARSLLESVLTPAQVTIEPIPYTLDENWEAFNKTLLNFKLEYAKARTDLFSQRALLAEKEEELNVIRMMLENVRADGLKESLAHLIEQYDLKIIGETFLPIELHLLGKKGSNMSKIEEIVSHPMALGQSQLFLAENENFKVSEFKDTATCAKLVANCKESIPPFS